MRPLALSLVLLTFALAGTAVAAPSAGFSDVDDTSPFCANVEWLKSRNITLGCAASTGIGSARRYCSNDAVSRLAMAVLQKRLDDVRTDAARLADIIQRSSDGP